MAGVLVRLRVDGVEGRVAAVGDEALGAVDDPLVALADGGGAHARDVGARVRLGQAERGEHRRLGELREVAALELLGAAERERGGGEAVGGDRGGDAGAAPAELLLDQAAGEVVEPGADVGLGDVDVHETHLPRLVDDLLGPRTVAVVVPGHGANLLLGEVVGQLAEILLLVRQREVNQG